MIGRLRGTLAHKAPPWLVIDVGGVGYELEAPMSTFYDLPEVGREIALAILSGVSVDTFARLVHTGDITALTKIPGIGKKTAERMVVELRDRAADLAGAGGGMPSGGMPADPLSEATIALQQLGYKPADAQKMAKAAASEGDTPELIIRKALQSALR